MYPSRKVTDFQGIPTTLNIVIKCHMIFYVTCGNYSDDTSYEQVHIHIVMDETHADY